MFNKTLKNITAFLRKYSFDRYLSGPLFAALTIIAVARAFQHYLIVDIYETLQYGLKWHIPFNLFIWWSWFIFVPFLFIVNDKMKNRVHRLWYWTAAYFVLPVIIITIRQFIATAVTIAVLPDRSDFYLLLNYRLFNNPWLWLDLLVYFAIFAGIYLIEYRNRNVQSELRYSQLQTQLAQSQLKALESQLHPHFLFNTLNTVSTLILKDDNKEAERMLSLLQKFLNTTLYESDRQEISLEEELRFINHYLDIEKVRFADKLAVIEEIAEETLRAQVPNFLLQPIIENAIYHAIAPKTTNGIIKICSFKENGFLSLSIEDNGPGITPMKKKSKDGVGLRITKERLSHLFGEQHTITQNNLPAGGLRVTIRIPFKYDDDRLVLHE